MQSKPNRAERIQVGHLIHLRVFDGSVTRDRIIQICSDEEVDHSSRPPRHATSSEFVEPFLGRERGHVTAITGSVATQAHEYFVELVDILQPTDEYDPALIDSFEPCEATAA